MTSSPISPTICFAKGEIIFNEASPPNGIYLICSGLVEVLKNSGGKEIMLARLGEGAIFGEMAIIDNVPRSATIKTLEDTWCYQHNIQSFLDKLHNLDPQITAIFDEMVFTLRHKNAKARIVDNGRIENVVNSDQSIVDDTFPRTPKSKILNNPKIQEKVAHMDYFMRRLFFSLIDKAYR